MLRCAGISTRSRPADFGDAGWTELSRPARSKELQGTVLLENSEKNIFASARGAGSRARVSVSVNPGFVASFGRPGRSVLHCAGQTDSTLTRGRPAPVPDISPQSC